MDERDQRLLNFLRELHGKDPEPPRLYLELSEAHDLMRDNEPGRVVFQDIDISGYRGKFRQSVEDSIRDGLSPNTWRFWYAARKAFLEYGGAYTKGLAPQGAY